MPSFVAGAMPVLAPGDRYHENFHIPAMAYALEQVFAGRTKRLLITCPPRSLKSSVASVCAPAWALGRNPKLRLVCVSHTADLAVKHHDDCRRVMASPYYRHLFAGATIARDKNTEVEFRTTLGGGRYSISVGGPLTGRGGYIIIIDDPMKSREEADSAARRLMISEWYQSTAYTRLEDGAAIVLVMTRWDVEDLAGYLLKAMVEDGDADQWEVVFLPALALEEKLYPKTKEDYLENLLRGIYIPMGGDQLERQPGQPLWPEKHDEQAFKVINANIHDFEFTALYQQMPRLAAGEYFNDQDFNIIEKAPEGLSWNWYIDLALGESETSDYNVTGGVALDKDGNLYIRDVLKVQELEKFLPDVREIMLADEERFSHWGVEDVAFQKLVFKEFLKDKALVKTDIRPVKPNGDKVQRAQPWKRRAKLGHVFLVRGKWNLNFIRVCAAFPKGRHDDEVDMVSGGVQMIAEEEGGDLKTASSKAVVINAEELFI